MFVDKNQCYEGQAMSYQISASISPDVFTHELTPNHYWLVAASSMTSSRKRA
jgi:hypothetical protein